MPKSSLGLTLAGIAALLLTACGSGGGGSGSSSSSSSSGGANSSPTANAGAAQTVAAGATVTLAGSGADSDGSIATYAWSQTQGATVTLSSTSSAQPTFTAPDVGAVTTLTFSLIVTDNLGASSAASTVNVTVNPDANENPTADAGAAQTVESGVMVWLNGAASSDLDGSVVEYAWTQTAGDAVTLSSAGIAMPSFVAPTVTAATTLTFSLTVNDNGGDASTPATVEVTVNPAAAGTVTVRGRVRYQRPPFSTTSPFGLDYGAPTLQAARGVTVRLKDSGTQAVLATSSTDINGNYSLPVAGNTSVILEAVAELLRADPVALPRWNVTVRNGAAATPYLHSAGTFDSAAGVTRNVDIPMNISAAGAATGTRTSGAFAALDTVYEGMLFILGADPQTTFPALIVDWGAQGEGTFFQAGNPQTGEPHRIALLGDLDSDTDEFDQHVVAHEFGHYVEHNFSRSDSIGGPHGIGEKLDIRVAFGEGFGYAFAAMVLDDPNARDSFVDNGDLVSGGFNVEANPPTTGNSPGCWCSESSVWSILYDIYDTAADSGDTLALGFRPIWDVLIGEQASTPAFTSIFSFVTALKEEQPASAGAINTLLSAQNIVTNTDEFGSTETTLPAGVPSSAVFPLYTTINNTGAVTLRTSNDAGTTNKVGNHRYIRFVNSNARNVTITLATTNTDTNADPDFEIWHAGEFVRAGSDPPPGPEVETISNLAAGTYVIDVYDCGNGCNPAEGAAGDFDLTVTIN